MALASNENDFIDCFKKILSENQLFECE